MTCDGWEKGGGLSYTCACKDTKHSKGQAESNVIYWQEGGAKGKWPGRVDEVISMSGLWVEYQWMVCVDGGAQSNNLTRSCLIVKLKLFLPLYSFLNLSAAWWLDEKKPGQWHTSWTPPPVRHLHADQFCCQSKCYLLLPSLLDAV